MCGRAICILVQVDVPTANFVHVGTVLKFG